MIDEVLREQEDEHHRRCGFVHLYGVSATCVLLALKRGLDPELCAAAGMLHDIHAYRLGPDRHAELGAMDAAAMLQQCGGFTENETGQICRAIRNHSSKGERHDPVSEVLKDADLLQHHLYDTAQQRDSDRVMSVCREFRIYDT